MPSIRSTTGELVRFAGKLLVGRGDGNDLRLDLGTVSTRHCVLEVREDGLFVRDLGSTNGTRVKGRKILGWTQLEAGDKVRFGPDSTWEVVSAAPERAGQSTPSVTVLESGRAYPVGDDRFVIGASLASDLRLERDGMPAVAAVIVLEDDARHLISMTGEGSGESQVLDGTTPFQVSGVDLRYSDESAGALSNTMPERASNRSYDLSLRLVADGEDGRILITAAGETLVFEGVSQRFELLRVLALAPDGWVDDEAMRIAVWGPACAAPRYNSALQKLIYDTRKMIAARGIDPFFIEKSRGRTRLRLEPRNIRVDAV